MTRADRAAPPSIGLETDPDWFASLEPGWQRRRIEGFTALANGEEAECGVDDGWVRFFRRMIEGVLGNEDAWTDVAVHIRSMYGDSMFDALGLDDGQFVGFVRSQVEPLFHVPFAQLDLRTMLIGDGATDGKRAGSRTRREAVQNWWAERRRQRVLMDSEGYGGGFDQATFLLSKQLVYFERYGKLFLPDTKLLEDPSMFRGLLDAPQLTPA